MGMLLLFPVVLLILAVHPFLTYPLSLLVVRRLHTVSLRSDAPPDHPLSLALCFCAYREEHVIHDKIANVIALQERDPTLKVYVNVDGNADRTGAILSEHRDRMTVLWTGERTGKTVGMSRLVTMAEADIIIFTDANVMLAPDAPERIRTYFRDPTVGCVCGHLCYSTGSSMTGKVGSLYWRLEEMIKQLESDTGSVMGANGSIFAIRRQLYQPPAPDIIDDIYVSLHILLDGHRIVCAPDAIAYEESISDRKEEFHRKIRIACQAFNVHRLLWPEIRRHFGAWDLYKYVSHKVLRWIAIYTLTLAALFFTVAFFAGGFVWTALGLWIAGLSAILIGEFTKLQPFTAMASVLEALAATGIGIVASLCGERFQTWDPATSIRRKG